MTQPRQNTTAVYLSVIIVSWNVKPLLRRAIKSTLNSWGTEPGLEIIVVDNASNDGSQQMVQEEFPQVRLIASAENLGFTKGNNQGIAEANGEFVLLLNPDTEVLGDALHQMVEYLETHPGTGMLGPQLRNPDNTVQSSKRRYPTLPVLFLESTWLQKITPKKLLSRYYAEDLPDDKINAVDWIKGAAMLTRRQVIEQIGGMDEGFFMYSEELDWCHRIKDAGWQVIYMPQAQIKHYEGKSSEQVIPARHIYFQSSKIRYTRKYFGKITAGVLRVWLMGQYIWQIAIEGLKWLVGHRRDLRAERIKAYRLVLHSGLRYHRQ
ncbi:MAG: glycosyltransferase family 2 protein [Anaerolineae bacterium]|nr:glycosyltransferase family 2 protein [Anaerolineae bacterium]